MKGIVFYFSHKGENICNEEIVNVNKGYTEIVAEIIAQETKSDIFELVPKYEYPLDYENCNIRAREESENSIIVEAKSYPVSIDEYDTIFIGFPIWYKTFPRIINSLLMKYDFSGKTVMPFCTNEENRFGYAEIQLMGLLHNAKVKDGLSIKSFDVDQAQDRIKDWLSNKL